MAEAKPQEEMRKLKEQGPGRTIISDAVVAKIAAIAAREVPGVHELGGAAERAIGGALTRITGAGRQPGVGVEVGEEEAAIDLNMIMVYGQSIPDVANQVRQNVTNQIESLTGLRVKEVNISVNDLFLPGEERPAGEREERVA
ncbi:MAG: Asp23/Gls24 family envelope stress response protein [Actinobacteria bacterium]|nr:Asp23/Gls24 family envelope stress response protein [Actinomycetota bacterium]